MAKPSSLFVSLQSLLCPGSRVSKGEKEGERDDVRAPADKVPHQAKGRPQLPVSSGFVKPTVRCWHDCCHSGVPEGHPASPKWLLLFLSQSPRMSLGESRWDLLLPVSVAGLTHRTQPLLPLHPLPCSSFVCRCLQVPLTVLGLQAGAIFCGAGD